MAEKGGLAVMDAHCVLTITGLWGSQNYILLKQMDSRALVSWFE